MHAKLLFEEKASKYDEKTRQNVEKNASEQNVNGIPFKQIPQDKYLPMCMLALNRAEERKFGTERQKIFIEYLNYV